MNEVDRKEKRKQTVQSIRETLVGGEGISVIEERRQKFEEKHTIKHEINDEIREEFNSLLKEGLVIKPDRKDIGMFFVAQFLPLIILGSSCFIPGLLLLNRDLWFIILIIHGGLAYLYALIRMICTFTYSIEFSKDQIKWRNIFKKNLIDKTEFLEIEAKHGYYLYFTKIGGVFRIGVEVIRLVSEENEFWIRSYPLSKKKSDKLVVYLKCWVEC